MRRIALGTVAALILAAVALAPVRTAGYCADSPLSGASFCDITTTSLIGLSTSLWAWLALSVVILAVAGWLVRRRRS
ncbi:hypothetical protein GCM10022219_14520 [Microbacterium oryzae]|uniref:Uncharacterized protein n=1 Tax=Microbacterium oryzae TaxID=743009 RepID=A0A6I6E717_9MICO|nr:hypothetical protein [Microbacterium oryzae]QGU28220.1 hypothetical protein D7D94_11445 [Microbacterium oryzae]